MRRASYLARTLGTVAASGSALTPMQPLLRRWQLAGRTARSEPGAEPVGDVASSGASSGAPHIEDAVDTRVLQGHPRGSRRDDRDDTQRRERASSPAPLHHVATLTPRGAREIPGGARSDADHDAQAAAGVHVETRAGGRADPATGLPADVPGARHRMTPAAVGVADPSATAGVSIAQGTGRPAGTEMPVVSTSKSTGTDLIPGNAPRTGRQPDVDKLGPAPSRDANRYTTLNPSAAPAQISQRDDPVSRGRGHRVVLEPMRAALTQQTLSKPPPPHQTVRIGAINIRIEPPPAPPQPVRRSAPATRATTLARGFVSSFGLRQG